MATAQSAALSGIQLSALVYAKFFRTRRMAGLKPSKYPAKEENHIPFKYYRTAVATIIRYHKKNNDPAVFDEAIAKLEDKIDSAEKHSKTIIPRNNLRAIENYRQHFGKRKFKPQSIPQMHFVHDGVVVGAKPEMVVVENGQPMLVRFDMKQSEPNPVEISTLLDVTTIAAQSAGVKVQPGNVLVFRVEDGTAYTGSPVSAKRKSQLRDACSEIKDRWAEI